MRQKLLFSTFIFILAILTGGKYFALSFHPWNTTNELQVSFLDVGQGDAIFIQAPNGKTMLIDAGPKEVVLGRLQTLGVKSNTLDILVITNPDADHISGFNYILDTYKAGLFIEPGTVSTTETYKTLKAKIQKKAIQTILGEKGTKVLLDEEKNIYFEILFPDRNVSGWTRNDGSLVGVLVYGKTKVMLMGDATKTTESAIMLKTEKEKLQSTIIKLGHHGSRTSSSFSWLKAVNPEQAIISRGKNNRYGHPHQEVLDRLSELHIPYLDIADEGTITFSSNGEKFTRVK